MVAEARAQVHAGEFTCTHEDVACCGVPCNDADALGVAFQDHDRLSHGGDETILRNLPNLWWTPTPTQERW